MDSILRSYIGSPEGENQQWKAIAEKLIQKQYISKDKDRPIVMDSIIACMVKGCTNAQAIITVSRSSEKIVKGNAVCYFSGHRFICVEEIKTIENGLALTPFESWGTALDYLLKKADQRITAETVIDPVSIELSQFELEELMQGLKNCDLHAIQTILTGKRMSVQSAQVAAKALQQKNGITTVLLVTGINTERMGVYETIVASNEHGFWEISSNSMGGHTTARFKSSGGDGVWEQVEDLLREYLIGEQYREEADWID